MSGPGRNDPCPCGSGEKYKRCCLEADRHAPGGLGVPGVTRGGGPSGSGREPDGPFLTPAMRAEAASRPVWEAEVIPIPAYLETDVAARLTAAVVVAGDLALQAEVRNRRSADPEDVAGEIERAVVRAAEAVGSYPEEVRVRHAEVAAALGERLAAREVEVRADRWLPNLEAFGASLLGSFTETGGPHWPPVSQPESWRAWGRPDGWIEAFFEAAAEFYRVAPWRWLANEQLLRFEPGDEGEGVAWTAVVLGQGGVEYGLALYSDDDDVDALLAGRPEAAGWAAALAGRVVSLTYEGRDALPRRMQREVASEGWEVAGPRAYPELFLLNTPAGGLTRRDGDLLVDALRAIPRFAERFREDLLRGEPAAWRDPGTGLEVAYEGGGLELDYPDLWSFPAELAPGGPRGPGARPEAALERPAWVSGGPDVTPEDPDLTPGDPDDLFPGPDREVLEEFEAYLAEEKGFSEPTVRKHTANAEIFLEFLSGWSGIPVAAVHEYDLRIFLFDWYPRKVWDSFTRVEAMPVSLKRFFRWLEAGRAIRCPWAEEVLGDRDAFLERTYDCPGGPWWDEATREWQAELYADLDRRLMLPDTGLAGGGQWGPTSGIVEAGLNDELARRWLFWRDELIEEGMIDPWELGAALLERQREWETTPRPELDGRTPAEAIRAEQRDQPPFPPSFLDPRG